MVSPGDMRHDQRGLCASDAAAFAKQQNYRHPKTLNSKTPKMLIVSFLEKSQGVPALGQSPGLVSPAHAEQGLCFLHVKHAFPTCVLLALKT